MGYPFFILSIYIITFFLLCLTCCCVDSETRGEVGLDDENAIQTTSMTHLSGSFEDIILEGDAEICPTEEKKDESIMKRLKKCFNKDNMLTAIKKLLTYFFIAGISADSSSMKIFITKRNTKISIITSVVPIAVLCIGCIICNIFLRSFEDNNMIFVVFGYFVMSFAILYIIGEIGKIMIVKHLFPARMNNLRYLDIFFSIIRFMAAMLLAYSHAFIILFFAIRSAEKYIISATVSAFCVSMFCFFFCLFIYLFKDTKYVEYFFKFSTLFSFHALATFVQIETIFSMALYFLCAYGAWCMLLLSIKAYVFLSLYAIVHEMNEKFFEEKEEEENNSNVIELVSNVRVTQSE